MDNTALVAPAADSPAAAPITAQTPPEDSGEQAGVTPLPDSLTKVPAIQGMLAGSPPAVSARIKDFEKSAVGKEIVANREALLDAGFAFYKSLHGDLAVMYNQFHIHGSDIQAADKAGKLQAIAPPFEKVDHELAKAGVNHPALSGKGIPKGFAAPLPQAAPQAGQGPQDTPQVPPAAGAASGALAQRLQQARIAALQPGAPTSGPSPGGGRLLNSILKQVV